MCCVGCCYVVACWMLGVVCGLMCVIRCFPALLIECWWSSVGVRCLMFVGCCLLDVVCGVLC